MKICPALALLEYTSVVHGLRAVDLMLKKAPIALLKCGTVHPGHYLALLGGTVASTAESHREGLAAGGIADSVLLPDVHPDVYAAVLGRRRPPRGDGLGVLEAANSCALLRAADAALKGVRVEVVEIRLADDLQGRALLLFSGALAEMESALELADARAGDGLLTGTLLPRLDEDLRELLAGGSRYGDCPAHRPADAELPEDSHAAG